VQHYVCHQSNQRIIESAVEKLSLPPERVYVNIDRYGNTSAASIPICLDELYRAGRIEPGKPIVLVAFGAGVTWASCVWNA
jgi:3-oxoacyl-[acyl-carrier-protein] synthase-3